MDELAGSTSETYFSRGKIEVKFLSCHTGQSKKISRVVCRVKSCRGRVKRLGLYLVLIAILAQGGTLSPSPPFAFLSMLVGRFLNRLGGSARLGCHRKMHPPDIGPLCPRTFEGLKPPMQNGGLPSTPALINKAELEDFFFIAF